MSIPVNWISILITIIIFVVYFLIVEAITVMKSSKELMKVMCNGHDLFNIDREVKRIKEILEMYLTVNKKDFQFSYRLHTLLGYNDELTSRLKDLGKQYGYDIHMNLVPWDEETIIEFRKHKHEKNK